MKINKYLVVLFCVIMVGCGSTKDAFYWGNYSSTLYQYKKNPDEKTLENHKKEIVKIIEYAAKKNKNVPPGVFAEYGYILIKEGKQKEGLEYLEKEIQLYPESKVLISKIKTEIERGAE